MPRSFAAASSQRIDVSAFLNCSGLQAFSIAIWVKAAAANNTATWAMCNSASAGPYFMILSDPTSPGAKFEGNMRDSNSGSGDQPVSNGIAFDNTWHHLGVTQPSGSTLLSYYLDGILDRTFLRTGLSNSSAQTFNNFCIGASKRSSVSNFFTGLLAHAALWQRELSAKAMLSLAKGLPPSFLNPDHYYPLWGTDSPEPDLGINAHSAGTLVNSPPIGAGGPPIQPSILSLAA